MWESELVFALSGTLTAPISGKISVTDFYYWWWYLSPEHQTSDCRLHLHSWQYVKRKGKKGEKKMPCLINWVELAWKILRDPNGSLKHIFLIFNFKQSWWGAKRVVNGVCRKKCIKVWQYHDGLWVFLFKSCYMIFICCLFYDVPLLQDFSSTPSGGCTHPLLFVPLQPHPRLLMNMSQFHSDVTFPKLSLIFLKHRCSLEAPTCGKQTLLQAWQNT